MAAFSLQSAFAKLTRATALAVAIAGSTTMVMAQEAPDAGAAPPQREKMEMKPGQKICLPLTGLDKEAGDKGLIAKFAQSLGQYSGWGDLASQYEQDGRHLNNICVTYATPPQPRPVLLQQKDGVTDLSLNLFLTRLVPGGEMMAFRPPTFEQAKGLTDKLYAPLAIMALATDGLAGGDHPLIQNKDDVDSIVLLNTAMMANGVAEEALYAMDAYIQSGGENGDIINTVKHQYASLGFDPLIEDLFTKASAHATSDGSGLTTAEKDAFRQAVLKSALANTDVRENMYKEALGAVLHNFIDRKSEGGVEALHRLTGAEIADRVARFGKAVEGIDWTTVATETSTRDADLITQMHTDLTAQFDNLKSFAPHRKKAAPAPQ